MNTVDLKQETSLDIDQLMQKLNKLQDNRISLDFLSKEIKLLKEELEKEEKKYSSKKFHYQKNLPYLEKVENDYNNISKEIIDINDRIISCEEKKKKIKTIREFKAINSEIEYLNQSKALKENELLDKKEDLEFKKEKMKNFEESLLETKESLNQKKEELNQAFAERKNDIKKMNGEKDKLETDLSPKIINLFARIYDNKKQLAIVSVNNNVCQGCYALLPLQIEVELKGKSELIFCPSCSRILYLEEGNDTE